MSEEPVDATGHTDPDACLHVSVNGAYLLLYSSEGVSTDGGKYDGLGHYDRSMLNARLLLCRQPAELRLPAEGIFA